MPNLTRDEARQRATLLSVESYEIDLDLSGAQEVGTYRSVTTVRFDVTENGAESFIDLVAPTVHEVTLNGDALDPAEVFADSRIALPGLLEGRNILRVVADAAYTNTGEGLHRFVDPVDQQAYLYTQFEVPDARRVFATFEQPDLKATFQFTVKAPTGWTVVSNSPTPEPKDDVWVFEPTPRISSYITALIVGPYHSVHSVYEKDGQSVPLGIYCRPSLAEHLDADAIFEVTRQGFDWFQEKFDYAYPFKKYDQLFVPEFNTGAMENAGAVTIRDQYVFRSKVTDAAYEMRAETILHELAHMWFGDLVTMEWWNDLWLNESFATYTSIACQAYAPDSRWRHSWTTFANSMKTWAYRQDQLPSTHPIMAEIRDLDDVLVNFDGITYAKGASVLKQLVAYVGEDAFFRGVQAYFKRHAFGNTRLSDLLGALEETSGRDLKTWSQRWLQTAGINILRPEIETDANGVIASFAIRQEAPALPAGAKGEPTLRPHRIAVGLYELDDDSGKLVRDERVELDADGELTAVPQLVGKRRPAVVLLNDDDLSYAKVRLDNQSLAFVTEYLGDFESSLPRALCWASAWDMTRDAELATRDYLSLVLSGIGKESDIGVVQSLHRQVKLAIDQYAAPTSRETLLTRWTDATLAHLRAAEAGSDHQLAWARAFAATARTPEQLDLLDALLDGTQTIEGLAVDTELRWAFVQRLAAVGRYDESEIAAEYERDKTAAGERHAATARASRPTEAAKAEAWAQVVESDKLPNAVQAAVIGGFVQTDQRELLAPYTDKYFEVVKDIWKFRGPTTAQQIVIGLFPTAQTMPSTLTATDHWLERTSPPPALRRLILEKREGIERALVCQLRDASAGTPDFVAHTGRRAARLDPADFFIAELGDITEPTVMFGLQDVHGDGSRTVELHKELDPELGRRIRALAKELQVSPATLFHAGWALVVAACGDRDTVVFGTVMSGRLQGPEHIERMFGSFINTLPVRLDLAGASVRDLVRDTDRKLRELVRHEQVPLSVARGHSGLEPDVPLFNVYFNYRHMETRDSAGGAGLVIAGVTPLTGVTERSNYPVAVSVDDRGHAFSVEALIDRAQDAGTVVAYLETAMAGLVDALAIAEEAERPALDLPVLPADMHHQVLAGGDEPTSSSDDRCLHTWFEEVAARRPDATAVTFGESALSYRELNAQANRLAHHLRDLGVGPDVLVALCLPRSEQMVIGLMAVLKAGGAYVPLDPASPSGRLAHALADSAPHVILTDGPLPDGKTHGDVPLIDLRADAGRWATAPDTDPSARAGAGSGSLAYVIYTSGSTGTPKGVMVEHRNVTRLFEATTDWFRFGDDDVWTLFHSFAFDFSVWEIWGALLHGGRLVIVPEPTTRDPREFYALLCAEGVTVLNQTPSAFRQLIAAQGEDSAPHRLRTVVFGGERLDVAALRPWLSRPVNRATELVNMYGITETTVHVTYRPLSEADVDGTGSPIGVHIPDLRTYVVDRHGQLAPVGAVGELYVGGAGVARGYLNRPELTAERFLRNPFHDEPDARVYRTGDLARRLPDGTLEFHGRNDQQIKLRGYRIELGEIEARLNAHNGVEDARVVLRDYGDEDKHLVGYVVPSQEHARPVRELLRLARTEPQELERTYELPNGLPVFHHNQSETDFVYEEIFTNQEYLRHGVTIRDGDTILDVGANIGMFTLFAGTRCPDATIYAFEPIPAVADSLRRNVALHGLNATVFDHGLAAEAKEEIFTFYSHNTLISSSRTTTEQAQELMPSYLRSQEELIADDAVAEDDLVDELVGARLDSEQFTCRLRPLSDVLAEQSISRVDLLKVNVENAEYEVLRGIHERDWPKIRQLVVQLHDVDGPLDTVLSLLKEHDYEVVCEQDNQPLRNTPQYNLYARRTDDGPATPAVQERPQAPGRGTHWPNRTVLHDDLRAALRDSLPEYMLPTTYVFLEELPLTRNGKLDHRALPEPERTRMADAQRVAPRTETERTLAAAWAELLHTEAAAFDGTDDFFALGGNSLLVNRLINLLRRQVGVELPVQVVFATPQFAELTAELERRMPVGAGAGELNVDRILAGLDLIEGMSDEELDALDSEQSTKEGRS